MSEHEPSWWCCSADYPNHAPDCKRNMSEQVPERIWLDNEEGQTWETHPRRAHDKPKAFSSRPSFEFLRADIAAAQLEAAVREARKQAWNTAISITEQSLNADDAISKFEEQLEAARTESKGE